MDNKKTNYIKSPLNYTGGKGKLLSQILPLFPKNIDVLVDLFCGGGNVGINANALKVVYNDKSDTVVNLLKLFKNNSTDKIIADISQIINAYGLSQTKLHGYAYYNGDSNHGISKYNKEAYLRLRNDFNNRKVKDYTYYIMLYTLIIFTFNNQIRFNKNGKFNLPVGKRDFNAALEKKLIKFVDALQKQHVEIFQKDFRDPSLFQYLTANSLVYCDPPYFITDAAYNENGGWTRNDEEDLYHLLDELNSRGIKFALSNVLYHGGHCNEILKSWIEKNHYNVHHLAMTYSNSNYHKKDRTIDGTDEILVTNY